MPITSYCPCQKLLSIPCLSIILQCYLLHLISEIKNLNSTPELHQIIFRFYFLRQSVKMGTHLSNYPCSHFNPLTSLSIPVASLFPYHSCANTFSLLAMIIIHPNSQETYLSDNLTPKGI